MVPIIVVGVIIFLILVWFIATSNGIKASQIKIKESLSGIDVALTKRFDTLTKMLDVVKGYQKHEKDMLTEIVRLRSGMTMSERNAASASMDKATRDINILAENYPELRSSANFVELQKTIADVEEHLQAARRLYNANVTSYNTKIVMFPNSIVAGMMGARSEEFFVADDVKRQDVAMNF